MKTERGQVVFVIVYAIVLFAAIVLLILFAMANNEVEDQNRVATQNWQVLSATMTYGAEQFSAQLTALAATMTASAP